MKKLFTFLILFFIIGSINSQVSYQFTKVNSTTMQIAANFNSTRTGPVLVNNAFVVLLVPSTLTSPIVTSQQGGTWTIQNTYDEASLESNCGETLPYYAIVVQSTTDANLGAITSGVSENLFTVQFSGSSTSPILSSSEMNSNGYATCLFAGGVINTISFDYDGNASDIFQAESLSPVPAGEVVLPIHLQSFTAKKFAANTSLLEWTTASEENASHMEIERSMDAKSWSYVATEKARGSLNYNTDYSFVDAEAVLQRDRFTTVYYRLKLVDNDGFSEYSEVRSVTFDNNGIVSLEAYPNPSTEVINLRMAVGETNTNTAQMMMLDMSGKLVKKQTVSANGISVLEVDQLETGVYNIIVKHEDKTYQKRVIKTN
ncbi:MAG TPA: T9SS type A sorting domain-containing protein [Saprospiraceae bacterium]|nr:T9SS type A sorting domain-containing protein [Saprospiraceae bacterium]